MKNCGKKILSVALAAAMSCSMISAFANTVSIESIKVLNNASDAGTAADKSSVSLTPEQLLQVTVKLSPESGATLSAGDITFLSYKPAEDGAEQVLDNTTIQYVDQQTTTIDNNAGTATITFRPRTGLGKGTFTAKAGGTDVTTAESFNYTVAEASKTMTMTGTNVSFEVGGTATFELKDKDSAAFADGTAMTVKNGTTTLTTTTSDTDVYYAYASGVLSVYNLPVGNHNISVSIDGYNDASAAVVVTAKTPTGPSDEDKNNAQNGLDDAIGGISAKGAGELTLPEKVTTAGNSEGYTISYTIEDTKSNAEISGGKLTLKEGKFGAKVQLKADLGNGVSNTKTVYLFATGTNEDSISFGNIDMIAAADGSDAFDDDTSFEAIGSHDYTAAAAEILNLALGRGNIANVPKGAVDINLDGTVTLAEYRMFKLLIDSSEAYYVPSNFAAARSSATSSGN